MYYVYILKSKIADQIYTGVTSDLKRRIYEHNSGYSIHTNKFKPWELTNYIAFTNKKTA
ncbi:MAG: GIY-YIG nuclease family protein [Segetibacter sp.]